MRKYQTANIQPSTKLSPNEASWIYNGLDCCVTFEIFERLRSDLAAEPANVQDTYRTAMQKVSPVLFMNMNGMLVDKREREQTIQAYRAELSLLRNRFDRICFEVLGYTVNYNSPVQVKALFYDRMKLKKKRKRNAQGFMAPTVNADALETFCQYFYPQVFARYILAMREVGKKLSFLESEMDDDGRMRTQLNIAGTTTGRMNSKFSASGTGTNLQNVENRLRQNFIPDDGHIFVNVDLGQADSRNLGARLWQIFHDSHGPEIAGKYLDACESGDLHTRVCQMAWRELKWPSDSDLRAARRIADQIFYRHFSYRDMAKRLGHGTNFFGKPHTMALHTKTDATIIEQFQGRYFNAFPLIGALDKKNIGDQQNWHGWIYRQLRDRGYLLNLFGRRRHFFDRYNDEKTLRDAIAYDPQSSTGEFLDRGWLQLWDGMPEAIFSLPVHDSILFQLPIDGLEESLPQALRLLRVEIELRAGRLFSIPLEAKTGFNWADSKYNEKTERWENPYGLRAWKGKEERDPPKRTTALKEVRSALRGFRR